MSTHHAPTSSAPAEASEALRTLLVWAIVAFLLTLVNRFAGFVLPIPPYGTFAGHFLALLYLALLLLALLQTARGAARLPFSTPVLLLCAVLTAIPMLVTLFLQQNRIPPPQILLLTANNFFLPIAAALAGSAIGRIIRHPNTLLAASGFALFFDIIVVTMGTVAQLMKTNSNLIAAVSVGAGSSIIEGAPIARARLPEPISGVTIGPADVLFLALFLAAVYQLRLSPRATFAWIFTLLFSALFLVELFSFPIPALAPMGIAVLIANSRHAAFTQQERRDLAIGAAFAVFCAVLIIVGSRAFIKPPPPPVVRDFRIEPIGPKGPIIVAEVVKDSPAEKAGVRPGDALYSFNGKDPMQLTGYDLEAAWDNARKNGIRMKVKHRNKGPLIDITVRYPELPAQPSSTSGVNKSKERTIPGDQRRAGEE